MVDGYAPFKEQQPTNQKAKSQCVAASNFSTLALAPNCNGDKLDYDLQ